MESIFKVNVENTIYKISIREASSDYIYYEVHDDKKTICTLRHELNHVGELVWAMIENQKNISKPFAERIGEQIDNYYR